MKRAPGHDDQTADKNESKPFHVWHLLEGNATLPCTPSKARANDRLCKLFEMRKECDRLGLGIAGKYDIVVCGTVEHGGATE
jgi:hypothetical protein